MICICGPILWISKKIWFRRIALLLCSLGWLLLLLHKRILNYITKRSFLVRIFKSEVPNDKVCRDIFWIQKEILIQLEVFFVLFWVLLCQLLLKCCLPCLSLLKEKLITKICCSDINKRMFEWNSSFICNKSI
jgi:hypothetical protein